MMDTYEKKYNEALERAKKEINTKGIGDTVDLCKSLFPELRESEDEKVIKALETFINQPEIADKITFEARIEWLSWLEKQKEQNCEDEECTDFTIYHPLKNGKGEYNCIPYSFYGSLASFSEDKDLIDFLRTCFYTEEECNEWIERQKEQKPAEWSEDIIREGVKQVGLTQHQIEWIRSHCSPQPKKEWSEEDEKRIKQLIYDTEHIKAEYEKKKEQLGERFNDVLIKDCDEQIAWLKSLRPQSKCEIYKATKHDLAIKFMNYLDENRQEGKMSLSNAECEDIDKAFKENDWAKILRYAEKYGTRN